MNKLLKKTQSLTSSDEWVNGYEGNWRYGGCFTDKLHVRALINFRFPNVCPPPYYPIILASIQASPDLHSHSNMRVI